MGRKKNKRNIDTEYRKRPFRLPIYLKKELSVLVDELFKLCTKFSSASSCSTKEWDEYLEIYNLVQKIKDIEKDILLPVYKREDEIEAFKKWLQMNGVKMNGVEFQNYNEQGFGLQCSEDIKEGSAVLCVPQSCIISEETARKSYLGLLIDKDPILQHMGNISLSLHILSELVSPSSQWLPYLRILPNAYNTTLYFNSQEMQLLKGSPAFSEAIHQFRNIARQYSYFYKILQKLHEAKSWPIRDYFTFDAYRWAVSTVMTRQNRIPAAGSSGQLALIPCWDMANHEQGHLSSDFENEKKTLICLAHRHFLKDEQFFIHYGDRSNSEFFIHSGFVYEGNIYDSLTIRLGVGKDDSLCEQKERLLYHIDLPSCGMFILYCGQNPLSPELLAFARVFSMNLDGLEKWLETTDKKKQLLEASLQQLDDDSALRFIRTRISLLLKAYPTTFEEDVESEKQSHEHEKLIRRFLIEEKKILINASNILQPVNQNNT